MMLASRRVHLIRQLRNSVSQVAAPVASESKIPQLFAQYRNGKEGSCSARALRKGNNIIALNNNSVIAFINFC